MQWLDADDGTNTIEAWARYFEAGEYAAAAPAVFNLFIEGPKTGKGFPVYYGLP